MIAPKHIVRTGYELASTAYRPDSGSAGVTSRYLAWVEPATRSLGPAAHVLDLGCGCGIPLARALAGRVRFTGIDISPAQVARAERLVPGATFLCADMCDAELPSRSFDLVVALYSIIHVPVEEQRALLGRIRSWLRPGGRMVATLGARAWTGTEADWLGVRGATMFWSHADAATYRAWFDQLGFRIVQDEFVPEPPGGHQLFDVERIDRTPVRRAPSADRESR